MKASDRANKIRFILDARRPMADRANKSDEILNKIDNQLRSFRDFIPAYAKRLDSDAAARINSLLPESEGIIAKIAEEKGKLALLSGRFTRPTLNIGVAGRARQGKSWFLQKVTGLTLDEIPSGNQGHCTGAPSIIYNHDSETTFADITFHSSHSFLTNVVAPFFDRLGLGTPPGSIAEFHSLAIPLTANENSRDQTTDEEFLKRLRFLKENLSEYEKDLTGQTLRISKKDIRAYIAQDDKEGKREDSSGKPYSKWVAVEIAAIYCRFPHQDLGSIAVVDTPGIGDFVSGADDRLVAMIGKSLDSIAFVRMPESIGALIKPEDTALHSVVTRAIPDLAIKEWSYFIINKNLSNEGNNLNQIPRFQKLLQDSAIRTKETLLVDCSDPSDVAQALDRRLTDIAGNLASLDKHLLERQGQGIKALASSIAAFAEKAASTLPKAVVVAPSLALLDELFGTVWINVGAKLQQLVNTYRQQRDEPDGDFSNAVNVVFAKLASGANLPSTEIIAKEAGGQGLMMWHADKLHELRVNISNSFEELNSCLDASFAQLRNDLLGAFTAEDGGMLGRLDRPVGKDEWQDLLDRWEGHQDGETVRRAIQTLRSASLSFRGFIQPRVRECIDVLDSDSEAAKDFAYIPGDSADEVKNKLEAAWSNACFNCRSAIDEMATEPSMARFAAAEDFRDAVLHTGGEGHAKTVWRLFYHENRGDVWPKQFQQLEADTRIRKEWDNAVRLLTDATGSLSVAV